MAGRNIKIYSETFPLKYLLSNHGLCLGVDTKRLCLLALVCTKGIIALKRPVGDLVVENNEYDIPLIWNALLDEIPDLGKRRFKIIHNMEEATGHDGKF
ncbi:MAG: hypothetical protein M1151_05700 [Candidatus Thermoplasmatota archaeon]|nr:hypothetical protein [Candidatus Thermoplasmatota archaeon]